MIFSSISVGNAERKGSSPTWNPLQGIKEAWGEAQACIGPDEMNGDRIKECLSRLESVPSAASPFEERPLYLHRSRLFDGAVAKSTYQHINALRGNRTPGGSMATTQVTTTPLMLKYNRLTSSMVR